MNHERKKTFPSFFSDPSTMNAESRQNFDQAGVLVKSGSAGIGYNQPPFRVYKMLGNEDDMHDGEGLHLAGP